MIAAFIPVEGKTLVGALYLGSSGQPGPAVLLLHGLPGHEKNLDLAADLRDRGIHSLVFHYRGSWGSGGDFSIPACLADAEAAFAWLRARREVDAGRVAIVGFSLGGWLALCLAARAAPPALCALVAPLIDPFTVPLPDGLASEAAATLRGTTPEHLTAEWQALPSAAPLARAIGRDRLLLVTADRDELFPPAHFEPLTAAVPQLHWIRFPRARHTFSDVRPGLRHVVTTWLVDSLRA